MAFVQDDEELDPNAPPSTGGDSGVISGGGSSTSSKGPSSPNAPGGMPGNFVGIQQYLDANKPQAAKLGNTIGGYVTDLGNTATSTVADQKSKFDQAIGQNTVDLDQGLYDEAQKNPQAVAADAGKKASFQKMYNANYGGPSQFSGSDYYTNANNANNAAIDAANQTKTPEGQGQLVSGTQKKTAGYSTPGATIFDQALLQASPTASKTINDAGANQSNLKANLDAVTAEEDKAARDAKTKTAATNATLQGTFGNQKLQNQIQNALSGKVKTASDEARGIASQTLDKLTKGGSLSAQELKDLGLTQANYDQINSKRGLVPGVGQYTGVMNADITPQNIASADDYARYQALNELTGQNANYLSNPSQAGTANRDAVKDFDLNKFLEDAAKASYMPASVPTQSVPPPVVGTIMPFDSKGNTADAQRYVEEMERQKKLQQLNGQKPAPVLPNNIKVNPNVFSL